MSIPALYYDGKTSRAHRVTLDVSDGTAFIRGEAERSCALSELRVSERTRHAGRKVTLPDDAYLEIQDVPAFEAMLEETGFADSGVVRAQQSWRGALMALALTAFLLVVGYLYGLPLAAEIIAKVMPDRIERSVSTGLLDFLDKRILAPSELPPARQAALSERFASMTPPMSGTPAYTIVYRKSRIGPNAFALPSGEIVMTDELVQLMENDEQVIAVLAHELGHFKLKHIVKRIVVMFAASLAFLALLGYLKTQTWFYTGLGVEPMMGASNDAMALLLFVLVLPVFSFLLSPLTSLGSRKHEFEADAFAAKYTNSQDLVSALVKLYEDNASTLTPDPLHSAFYDSHPPASVRINRLLSGGAA